MLIELKKEIKSRGIQQKMLASKIGVSEAVFSAKLHGKSHFYADEAYLIMRVLGITANGKNFERLFFTKEVHSECT